MTRLRNLLTRTAEVFWQFPALWLPVLIADLLSAIVSLVLAPTRRAVISALLPRSVLGGYGGPETHLPLLPIVAGGLLLWCGYLFRLFAYLYALGVTTRMVHQVLKASPLETS